MRRNSIFWGVVLILLGGLLFLQSAGFRLPGGSRPLDYFWALLLILSGAWVILNVFMTGGSAEEENLALDLQGASKASLHVHHGAGVLRLGSGAPAGQFLNGTFGSGIVHRERVSGESLDVDLRTPVVAVPFFGPWQSLDWDVRLKREIPTALYLETGASKTQIDLRDLQVTFIDLDAGASSIEVTMPSGAGQVEAKIDIGAASLEIRVPDGVAARIRVEQGVSAVEIDPIRFPRSDRTYESSDFASATNRIDMDIHAGAGKVSIH
jgi:hypothetical protein